MIHCFTQKNLLPPKAIKQTCKQINEQITKRHLSPPKTTELISEWIHEQISKLIHEWLLFLMNWVDDLMAHSKHTKNTCHHLKPLNESMNKSMNKPVNESDQIFFFQCANDRFMQLNHSGKVNSVPAEHTATAINIQMCFFGHCIAFHAVS